MKAKIIQKYSKYTISKLVQIAQKHFNKCIRLRDIDLACISCGSRSTLEAGHFYSAGHYSALRFNEDNVNGQCKKCNQHLSGNLIEYQKGLIKKVGQDRVDELHALSEAYKRMNFKWDRFSLIETIEKYKSLNKT